MINFRWNNIDFAVMQFGKGIFKKDMVGHTHSKNSYELHYILEGEGVLTTDTKIYNLSKGDFFITGPHFYHQQSTNVNNALEEIYIYIQASEKKKTNAIAETFLATCFYYEKNSSFSDILFKIIKENDEKKLGYKLNVSALIQILLTEITRNYWPDFNLAEESDENLNDRRFIIIEHAFINDPANITLSKLSDMIGLCERQTQRILHKYYGKTFIEKKKESIEQNKSFKV